MQAAEPHRVFSLTGTTTASGVRYYVHCNPINKFDPLGLTADRLVNAALNNMASRIDNMSVPTSMSMGAALVSEGLRYAAYMGSATQAKDMYNSSVDRMTTAAGNMIDSGANGAQVVAGVATLGLSDTFSVTPFVQGVTKRDVVTGGTLSNGEALRQTVQGICQMILAGAAAKAGYDPAAQTGQLTPKPTTSNPGLTATATKPTTTPPQPEYLYRSGGKSPSNFTTRPSDNGLLSTRDSLSNPYPLAPGQQPPLPAGKPIQVIDTSRLPAGSVVPDGAPYGYQAPGHVSIENVAPEVVKEAVVETIPKAVTQ